MYSSSVAGRVKYSILTHPTYDVIKKINDFLQRNNMKVKKRDATKSICELFLKKTDKLPQEKDMSIISSE